MSDPATAREQAREILSERRFHESPTPRPLRRPLEWLGDRLAPLRGVADDVVRAIDRVLPGGRSVAWILIGALVLAAAVLVATRLARRRSGVLESARARSRAPRADDPVALERAADAAERDGDFERALRLRFRSGLLRLDAARVLPLDASLTTGAVRRRLGSPEFDRIAVRFDEVLYGRRAPGADDARAAREGWARVLAETRR